MSKFNPENTPKCDPDWSQKLCQSCGKVKKIQTRKVSKSHVKKTWKKVTFSEAQKFAEIKSAWIKKQIKRFSSSKTVSLYKMSSKLSLKYMISSGFIGLA